jgi:protein-S-isoprenylcysteine O-methyltransferase Ste14
MSNSDPQPELLSSAAFDRGSVSTAAEPEPKSGSFRGLRKWWAAQNFEWLKNPWVDKACAILTLLPVVYPIVRHFRQYLRPAEALMLTEVLLFTGTMIFRRLPVRVTTNPYHWLIASLAVYWSYVSLIFEQHGRPIGSPWLLWPLYPCSACLVIWSRISLGRNIAIVPAQRDIVESGAYRWMRHPIYTAFFLSVAAAILQSYSLRNLVLYSLAAFWFILRTLAEEEYLKEDPKYRAYMRRVRWRWIPGVV